MAELEKLTITQCTVSTAGNIEVGSEKFTVMLNPSSFSHDRSITYTNIDTATAIEAPIEALGRAYIEPKFVNYGTEKVSFNLVLDGTGVVGNGWPIKVKEEIDQLKKVAYEYVGKEHEPSVVRLVWGTFKFNGRLDSMKVEYTLFKPSGEPLRAKVTLSFVRYLSKEEEALLAKRSSPDLTHVVEVNAGDTLPLLCHRIYKDSSYYAEVARINNIVNFRGLKPGSRLEFPPLR